MTQQNAQPELTASPSGGRAEEIAVRAFTAGCVAVCLYGVAATTGWLSNGSGSDALGQIALGVPVVFTVATAIRALSGAPFKDTSSAPLSVVMDVSVCLAALVFMVIVASFAGNSGMVLWGVAIMAPFLLPMVLLVSVVSEVVQSFRHAVRGAMVGAAITGIAALILYTLERSR